MKNFSLHSQEGRINIRLAALPAVAADKFKALQILDEDTTALTRVKLRRDKPIEKQV